MRKFLQGAFLFFIPCLLLANTLFAQEYRLGPEDVLKITVYREEEMDRQVRVSSDGYISLALLGKIQAEGCTVSELEDEITEELKVYIKQPHVTIFIEEYSTITVTGQVKEPGAYPLKSDITVLELIGLAGGFTKLAARNAVKVLREEDGEKISLRVRVADISKGNDRNDDISLKRGDIVVVPETMF